MTCTRPSSGTRDLATAEPLGRRGEFVKLDAHALPAIR
eukprot:CAMPEP_0114165152 /NCGR_PEP_ID=MMETSP0043_2-20121206/31085_1 /TAXON_ID=464988 /ORGANISM="Hemiselmis andersenii, Strain CCMP644" /LENGTH=37 /DNA_ID= /DNA_START= /DNA_END= /DNA_ORIENTATION=